MTWNNVYDVTYWNKSAKAADFMSILFGPPGESSEKFWNYFPEKEKLSFLTKEDVFLDIGCGFGRVARHVAPLVKEYHGIDYSSEMVVKAKEFNPEAKNAHFYANNGKDFSFLADNMFDVIYTVIVFQHMPKENMFNYIAEAQRVLKSGGFFLCTSIPKAKHYVNGWVLDDVSKVTGYSSLTLIDSEYYYGLELRK